MKKLISLLLAVLLTFSVGTIAFAGSYKEEAAQVGVYMRCPDCDNCKGTFAKLSKGDEYGCKCCKKCPNYVDENGVAVNLAQFSGCAVDSYFDITVYKTNSNGSVEKDAAGNYILEHKGDYITRYYWKARCCSECTGRTGCRCNNQDYKKPCGCPYCFYEPDHTEEKIQEGVEKGQEGYTKGIQAALIAVRNVMYDLFNKLFAFLKIDIILGKDRVPSETV